MQVPVLPFDDLFHFNFASVRTVLPSSHITNYHVTLDPPTHIVFATPGSVDETVEIVVAPVAETGVLGSCEVRVVTLERNGVTVATLVP